MDGDRKARKAAYARAWRAKKKADGVNPPVPPAPAAPAGMGAIAVQIALACASMPKAQTMPEVVAIAMKLAEIADSGTATAAVQATRQLTQIMDSLRGGSTRGKLAEIREGSIRS